MKNVQVTAGLVNFHDYKPYWRTANTLLLKILSFVSRLMCVDLQTLHKAAKAPLALESL